MLALAFGAVSLLYATVGQAGGTAFLALMAFASFPSNVMRPTALLLNIVVTATFSTWLFNRESLVDWAKLRPLLLASLPTALVGGFITLDERLYKAVTGSVLLLAAMIIAVPRTHDGDAHRPTPSWGAISTGSVVGLVSGLTGVGGGVFLAPLLIALRWASPKRTAALSAPFILGNSVVGLVGAMCAGQTFAADTWLAAIGGAVIGAIVGLRWWSETMTRYVLAAILGAAGIQMLFF